MEFDLLDKKGKAAIKVTQINVHAYSLKGYEGTGFSHIHLRINPTQLKNIKYKFELYTDSELKKKIKSHRKNRYTLSDLLITANYFINCHNTGDLWEDNESDSKGKAMLQEVINLIIQGYELSDSVVKK